jgi:hypothetical protein
VQSKGSEFLSFRHGTERAGAQRFASGVGLAGNLKVLDFGNVEQIVGGTFRPVGFAASVTTALEGLVATPKLYSMLPSV